MSDDGAVPGQRAVRGGRHSSVSATGRGYEAWVQPSPRRIVLTRLFVTGAAAFVVMVVAIVLTDLAIVDEHGLWPWSVAASAVALVLLPLGMVPAWRWASLPYPHDRTVLLVSRALEPEQRRAVRLALHRGEAVADRYREYAVVHAALQRRSWVGMACVVPISWGQVVNTTGNATSVWFPATMGVLAAGLTAAAVHGAVGVRRGLAVTEERQ